MATKHRTATDPLAPQEGQRIPPPVPSGTEHLESLGRFIDNLMGDARARRAVAKELEPLFLKEGEMPEDPEPAEPPPAVPGGTETETRGPDSAQH